MNQQTFIQQFNLVTANGLPGEEAHKALMPIDRPFSSEALKNIKDYKKSAVGIILFKEKDSLHCVLIQRPQYNGVHGNQISFPGGKMDASDSNLEITARRECMEEISLQSELMTTIGRLTQVFIPVSKFLVQPFIFFVENMPELIPDQREVDEIFTFDIRELLADESLKSMNMQFGNGRIQKNVPYFAFEERIIWGATAMILAELKGIIKQF
ncbi:CoA pyrophosphatase [Crocinitomicaceae bacterium]|nr:CoA pyrophosphatase [Crocinitomicaceae bacterium]